MDTTVTIIAVTIWLVIPALILAAAGARLPRVTRDFKGFALVVLVIYACFHAYVRSDEKPQPPGPPPGPYNPGSEWQCILHHDPFSGRAEYRWEYRLPPSHPEIPVEKEPRQ